MVLVRRFLVLAFWLLACAGNPLLARDSAGDGDAGGAASAVPPRPPLWQISDHDTRIVIFGTIHALPSKVDWFDGRISTSLDAADEVVTEIGEVDARSLQAALVGRGTLPQGESLRAMLTQDEKLRLEAALDRLDAPHGSLDRAKPWFAAVRLVFTELDRNGVTKGNGVEAMISGRARSLGKPIIALETADYQFAQFDSMPVEAQRRYLIDVIDNLTDLKSSLLAIVDAWQAGEAELLAQLLNDDANNAAFAEALLYPRNKNWAEWIDRRMDKPGMVFMAVGAGHLSGQGSVLELLREKGIQVERIQ